MRGALITFVAATLVACGAREASTTSGTPATSSPLPSGTTSSAPPPGSTSTPVSYRSPIPADGPCTTTPGIATKIYSGEFEFFSVDDDYAYLSTNSGVLRISLSDLTTTTVEANSTLLPGSIAIAPGFLILAPDILKAQITTFPLDDSAATSAYGDGLPFDGVSVYVGAGSALTQIPIDGSAPITTSFPSNLDVTKTTVGSKSAFVAATDVQSSTPTAAIYGIPINGSVPTMLASNIGPASSIATDDTDVYFSAGVNGSLAIARVPTDGSGTITSLVSIGSFDYSIAVDAQSIYFNHFGVTKLDKASLATSSAYPEIDNVGDIVVRGGNLYVHTNPNTSDSALVTFCK